MSCREVIDDADVFAPGDQRADEVMPDEAGTARYENLHDTASVWLLSHRRPHNSKESSSQSRRP